MSAPGPKASSVGFWGLALAPSSSPHSITVPRNRVLRLSSASLPASHAITQGNKPHIASLVVNVENEDTTKQNNLTLCTLVSSINPCFSLDIFFMKNQKITLSTTGGAPIHVTGYQTLLDDAVESSEEESRAIVPVDDVDAEIDITELAKAQRKRKASQNAIRSIVDELASFGDDIESEDELDDSFRPDDDMESESIDEEDEDEDEDEDDVIELGEDEIKELAKRMGLVEGEDDDEDEDEDEDEEGEGEGEEGEGEEDGEGEGDEQESSEEEIPVQVGNKRKAPQQSNGKQQMNGKQNKKQQQQVKASPKQVPQASPKQTPQTAPKQQQQKKQPQVPASPQQSPQQGKKGKQQQPQQQQQQQQQQPTKKQKIETSSTTVTPNKQATLGKLKCPSCPKELPSEFSLKQHITAKHSK